MDNIKISASQDDKCLSKGQIDTRMLGSKEVRESGIDIAGFIPWGSHFCVFYQSKEDLLDILAPYFKAGLENNEFCVWITSELFSIDEAENAMRKIMPDFQDYLVKGQMEILPHTQWYLKNGVFDQERVFRAWMNKLNSALGVEYDGIRVTGDTLWLERKNWKDFSRYEREVEEVIGGYKMIAICSYHLDRCNASDVLNMIKHHRAAFIRREGKWEIVESSRHKKVDKALCASEQKFKDLVETTTDWVWEVDKDGVYTYVSPKVKELLGYEISEVLGKTPFDLMPAEEAEKIGKFFEEKLIKKEPFYRLENINRRKDGQLVVLETSGIPVFDEKGRLKGYRGIDRDIAGRKKAEERVRLFSNAVAGAIDAEVIADKSGNIVYVNQAAEKLYGYEEGELIGESVKNFHPDRKTADDIMAFQIKTGSWCGETLQKKKDGKTFSALVSLSSVKNKKGNTEALLGVVRDITERKNMEEKLRVSEMNLKKQNLSLEQKKLAL
ncbi:MAG: PAS domain S-box protein [Candidatus Omnitrophota bacterium]